MPLELVPTRIDGPLLLQPSVFGDERGFFCETYRESELAGFGVTDTFVQDNHSRSGHGIARGLHFNVGDGASKLVRCGRGAIVDVLVDLRRGSPTYGEWEGFALSDENMRVLYAPVGFAHGFCVTGEIADVMYKQSAYYSPDVDRAISLLDPDVAVEWPLPAAELLYSERDANAPRLADIADDLPFVYAG